MADSSPQFVNSVIKNNVDLDREGNKSDSSFEQVAARSQASVGLLVTGPALKAAPSDAFPREDDPGDKELLHESPKSVRKVDEADNHGVGDDKGFAVKQNLNTPVIER